MSNVVPFPARPSRPALPAAVKRQLRQESGFGCCVCGHPFIEFHHIVPWAEEQHFRPDDMMALCPTHHAIFGQALPPVDQRKAKARPKNVADGQVRGLLYVNSRELAVRLGGGLAVNTPNLLNLAGRDVLSARLDPNDGRLLVSAIIQDQYGIECGRIVDNEWAFQVDRIWDLDAAVQKAAVRSAPRAVQFAVDARKDELWLEGEWHSPLGLVSFGPKEVTVGTNVFRGNNTTNCAGYMAIG